MTPSTNDVVLLPCPHCGSTEVDFIKRPTKFLNHAVECHSCLAEMGGTTQEQAAYFWNRRADRAAHAAEEGQQWISVEERLPEKEVDVLCRRTYRPPIVAGWFEDGFYAIDDDEKCIKYITHWMPLPPPPSDAPPVAQDAP